MSGWIKLYRAIQDHWVFSDPDYFRAWCIILMKVNHEPKKVLIRGQIFECGRGQSLFSLHTWVEEFGVNRWSIRKVRTFFKLLENDKMIVTEGMQKTTRLTVCNYESYQDVRQANDKQTTSRRQTDDKQTTTTKEGKNVKNEKKIGLGEVEIFVSTINKTFNKNYKPTEKLAPKVKKILTEYDISEISRAVNNAKKDNFHAENGWKHLTPEFFTRSDKVEKWLNAKSGSYKQAEKHGANIQQLDKKIPPEMSGIKRLD